MTASNNKIGAVKRMAIIAMCLTCISSNWAFATKQIFFLRDSLQMARVDTPSVPAEVVEMKSVRRSTIEELVRESMSGHVSIIPKIAVALSLYGSSPYPTTSIWLRENLLKEPLFRSTWTLISSHEVNIHTNQCVDIK